MRETVRGEADEVSNAPARLRWMAYLWMRRVADGSEWTVVTWPFQPAAALLVLGRVNNCWTTGGLDGTRSER